MPITRELDNLKKFESAGFNHEQAETLASVIEQSHADSQESLKEFINHVAEKQTQNFDIKLGKLETLITTSQKDIDIKLGKLETRIMASQKDMLIKMFGIVAGCITVAVTILKLFP
jgi:hypothetical protein